MSQIEVAWEPPGTAQKPRRTGLPDASGDAGKGHLTTVVKANLLLVLAPIYDSLVESEDGEQRLIWSR